MEWEKCKENLRGENESKREDRKITLDMSKMLSVRETRWWEQSRMILILLR